MQFPSASQYTPLLVNGTPLFDNFGDESPQPIDIVGNSTFPAGFIAYDGENIFFRLRLNADPRQGQGFRQFAWGVLFNTTGDAGTYDWLLNVDGLDESVNIYENIIKEFNSWNDPAEGINGNPNFSQPITNFDYARVILADSSIDGDQDYFLDWFLPADTIFNVMGINETSTISTVYFSSANSNNYNKDSLQTNEGFEFIDAFTDPITVEDTDVRARLSVAKTLTSGPTQVEFGETATWTGTVTVSNIGKALATAILANDVIGLDNIVTYSIDTISQGTAVFNGTTKTVTWDVGNLAAGDTATLTFTATGSFTDDQQASFFLDQVTADGVDNLSGDPIQSNTATIPITVLDDASVNGTIIDSSNGEFIAGATVELKQGATTVATTSSDINGFYGFVNVAPGNYTVVASNPPDYTQASVPVTVASGESVSQDIFLSPATSTIQGTVTGSAIPQVNATVRLLNNFGVEVATTTTNVTGNYSFLNVTPGPYIVEAIANNFQSAQEPVITEPNTVSVVDFDLLPNPGAIEGTVFDQTNGDPIPNATVEVLTNQGVFVESTTTDALGYYLLEDLAEGTYIVRASAADYGTNSVSASVTSGVTTTSDVPLQPVPGTISGNLTDDVSGQPISGAVVQIINSSGQVVTTGTTDALGNYTIENLVPGSYSVVFSANGYSNTVLGAIVTQNQTTTLDAGLDPIAGLVTGTVTDNAMIPIEGALVTIVQNNIPIATDITDQNGNYEVPNLAPGSYTVVVSADNFTTETVGTIITSGETTVTNVVLAPDPGTLSGNVTNDSGDPIAGATISIQTNVGIILTTVTDSNGNYVVEGLAPGNYTVTASAPNFQTQIIGASISSNQTTASNFILVSNPGGIIGQITNVQTGDPILGANIEVRILDSTGAIVSTIFSDTNGQFSSNQLAPGEYTLVFSADNFQTTAVSTLVEAGQTATVNVGLVPDPGSIQGTVLDINSQAPLAGAEVTVVDGQGFVVATVITDVNGVFTVNGLTPNSYNVTAIASGYQNNTIGAIVLSGETTPVAIELEQNPGSITGVVNPIVPGTVVRLFNASGVFISSVIADDSGAFSFNNLAPGNYTVTASANNYVTATTGVQVVSNQASPVTLTMQPSPASVSGRIVDANNQPIQSAIVEIRDAAGDLIAETFTNANGEYFITGLGSGSYTVEVFADGYAPSFTGVTVSSGEMLTDINLTLVTERGGISGLVTNADTGDFIPGATVTIRDVQTQEIVAVTTTTSSGTYLVGDLPIGEKIVTASKTGFATGQTGAIVTARDTTGANIALTPNPGTISGLVVDEDGNPITENNTTIIIEDENKTVITSLLANPDGTFTVPDLAPGTYYVVASAPGYASSTVAAVVVSNQTTNVTNVLVAFPVTLTSTVIDATTLLPISGATVTVEQTDGVRIAVGLTNANGQITFNNLPSGELLVTGSKNDYGSDSKSIFSSPGDTVTTTLRLSPVPAGVNGFVTNLDTGEPIPDSVIQLYDDTSVLIKTVLTDSTGAYVLTDLAPGNYTIVANASGFGPETAGVFLSPGQIATVSFAMTPSTAVIEGTVTSSVTGLPVPGATVVIRQDGPTGPIIFTTVTDENGFYRTTELSSRVYVLVTREPEYSSENDTVVIQDNTTIILNFQLTPTGGGVQGIVRSASSGLPLANTLISVIDGEGNIIATIPTDINGEYFIYGLAPGSYDITATNPNYQAGIGALVIETGVTETVNFLLLNNPATLQGYITDGDTGNKIIGALAEVFVDGVLVGSALSDGMGYYRIQGIPVGRVTLRVSYPGYGTSINTVDLRADEIRTINVPLSRFPASVYGRVTNSITGEPIANVQLTVTIPGSDLPIQTTYTDELGRYTLVGLPPGTYVLIASTQGYEEARFTLTLDPFEALLLNISLVPLSGNLSPECISIDKVYDWVVFVASQKQTVFFPQAVLTGASPMELRTSITGIPTGRVIALANGNPGVATIRFEVTVQVEVIENGSDEPVLSFEVPVTFDEELAICIPEPMTPSNVSVKVMETFIRAGSTITNEQFTLLTKLCVEVESIYPVKLELLGGFCSPRTNPKRTPEDPDDCTFIR
ncbi:carboxypeptidase regulatory-like domain-containing protein [Bacillus sp. KH172YL63]|uniref:carboxypeptidase regulatory-like domain-containing protein n=1 Tax=Bacillus sp. KH172YL63 TaxID=2709784 RepID=UPI0013E41CB9|nr:carboxypeptidase regulatory-like domain-containing protein [Bacillus sp. KH172YL63]BCB03802.1 hypothetical protein KH172YL63_19350 [Bacillus sp. KH172YL63]